MTTAQFIRIHSITLLLGTLIWNAQLVFGRDTISYLIEHPIELWHLLQPQLAIGAFILSVPYILLMMRAIRTNSTTPAQKAKLIWKVQLLCSIPVAIVGVALGIWNIGDGGLLLAGAFINFPIIGTVMVYRHLRRLSFL